MPVGRVKSVLSKSASRSNVKFSAQKIVSARKTQGRQIKNRQTNLFPRRVIKSGVCRGSAVASTTRWIIINIKMKQHSYNSCAINKTTCISTDNKGVLSMSECVYRKQGSLWTFLMAHLNMIPNIILTRRIPQESIRINYLLFPHSTQLPLRA